MATRDNFILKAIQAICWIIFLGYCTQAGAILFNYAFSLFRPIATQNLYLGLDLSAMYAQHPLLYTVVMLLLIGLSAGKAYVFLTTIRLFKAIHLQAPFHEGVATIIMKITGYTFSIGMLTLIAEKLAERLYTRGFAMGDAVAICVDGSGYLITSAILFVIALIFRKGIALQKENELTI